MIGYYYFSSNCELMELGPFKSITGSDIFWDGSIPNPLSVGIPTSVSQTTPETSVAGLGNHLTSDLVPNRSVTTVGIPIVSSVTHTFARPVDTVVYYHCSVVFNGFECYVA